jgi:hypothetical protein
MFKKILSILLISFLISTQLVSAASPTNVGNKKKDVQTIEFQGEEYTYSVDYLEDGTKEVVVFNESGTDKSTGSFDPSTETLIINGEVQDEENVDGFQILSDNFSSLAAKDDGPSKAISGPPSGSAWSFYGTFTGKINTLSAVSAFLSGLLLIIPGGAVAVGWWSVASQAYASVADEGTIYIKSNTYRQWDTSLSPDQYMYWSSIWMYKNSNRTGYIWGFDLKTYGW